VDCESNLPALAALNGYYGRVGHRGEVASRRPKLESRHRSPILSHLASSAGAVHRYRQTTSPLLQIDPAGWRGLLLEWRCIAQGRLSMLRIEYSVHSCITYAADVGGRRENVVAWWDAGRRNSADHLIWTSISVAGLFGTQSLRADCSDFRPCALVSWCQLALKRSEFSPSDHVCPSSPQAHCPPPAILLHITISLGRLHARSSRRRCCRFSNSSSIAVQRRCFCSLD
jgi:hypothetical protein